MSDSAPATPERLVKVSSLFHAARNLPLAERDAFLQAQCGTDLSLRREVESLLRIEPELPTEPGPLRRLSEQPLPASGQVGPYQLVELVGIGGMGVVYRAHDPRLGRDVALKVLLPEVANDPERIKRFQREARATARLSHPNIVPVFEFTSHEGTTCIVSEFVNGPTLRRVLENGRLDVRRAINLAIQLAEGLAAAHAADVIHRDLKPENVLLNQADHPRLVDFGLAKMTVRLAESDEDTVPGTKMGTPGYMAPEQFLGLGADHRADIFSLGAVLYELLCGAPAFPFDSSLKTVSEITNRVPAPLVDTPEHPMPMSLRRIVDRCLEIVPAERFQSASDLAFALKSVDESQPEPLPRRVRTPALDILWLVAAVAFGALLMFLLLQPWRGR